MTCLFAGSRVNPQIQHIQNNREVYEQYDRSDRGNPAEYFIDFKWQVEAPKNKRKPLCPRPRLPQPVGLDEAQGGVDSRPRRNRPELRIGHAVGQIEKDLRIAAVLTDVEKPQQAGGDVPGIAMDQGKNAESHTEN